jgi:cell division cycle 20-like protein 1 (cofactor of APC complex)
MKTPMQIYKHCAAVKGLSWHPTKPGILVSGGGIEDRCIKIWNINTNELMKSIDTGSQVCNLLHIKGGDHLVSTHGFNKF